MLFVSSSRLELPEIYFCNIAPVLLQWSEGAMKLELYVLPALIFATMSAPSGSSGLFGLLFAAGIIAQSFTRAF